MKKGKWGGVMVGTNEKNCGTKDTHINFGEYLDPIDWNEADEHCKKADLCIIAGTSMSLRHITHFPFLAKKVVLINLQATPDDDTADLRIWAKCDPVFEGLMERLNIPIDPIPVWKPRDSVPIDKIPKFVHPYYIKKAQDLESFYQQLEKDYQENGLITSVNSLSIKTVPDQVLIGNYHENVQSKDTNTHKWTMYVRGVDSMDLEPFIESVEFHLHPTFSPPMTAVARPPYSICRLGWGTFTVKVVINWKPEFKLPALHHKHDLSFSSPDTFQTVTIPK